jgi:hypothetical protein
LLFVRFAILGLRKAAMSSMMPVTDLNTQVAKLERDYRNLQARLEKLEGRRGWFAAALGNVLLLVLAGLMADYLGWFPPAVDRLPLAARRVEAEEFVLRDRAGTVRARLVPEGDRGYRVVEANTGQKPARP